VSKAKAKGTSAESALVKYLVEQGYPNAERRALSGSNDMGDVSGCIGLVWEVKNHKTYSIPAWLDETQVEAKNANADFGILAIKPNKVGLGNVENWWAIMTIKDVVNLLRDAGYGDPR
jgi:Holliday junction resolvase